MFFCAFYIGITLFGIWRWQVPFTSTKKATLNVWCCSRRQPWLNMSDEARDLLLPTMVKATAGAENIHFLEYLAPTGAKYIGVPEVP